MQNAQHTKYQTQWATLLFEFGGQEKKPADLPCNQGSNARGILRLGKKKPSSSQAAQLHRCVNNLRSNIWSCQWFQFQWFQVRPKQKKRTKTLLTIFTELDKKILETININQLKQNGLENCFIIYVWSWKHNPWNTRMYVPAMAPWSSILCQHGLCCRPNQASKMLDSMPAGRPGGQQCKIHRHTLPKYKTQVAIQPWKNRWLTLGYD